VEHCLGIQAGEVVSIVTDSADPDRIEIARVFWEEARVKGAEVILAEMLPRKNSGEEPPAPIAQLMAESKVVLCPTTKSLSHTQARRIASARGARSASLPTITKEMVVRCLTADYRSIAQHAVEAALAQRHSGDRSDEQLAAAFEVIFPLYFSDPDRYLATCEKAFEGTHF
jgi:leucyl aminopeptidase (aminopeptidase T)